MKETFIPKLKHVNLECTGFAPSRSLNVARGALAHKYVGCAIFHNAKKFDNLHTKSFLLRDYIPKELYNNPSAQQLLRVVGMKHNPMMLALLRHKISNQTFIVGNTHLFWDPERSDVKAIQAASIGLAIQGFLDEIRRNETLSAVPTSLPVVLCGDFNALPTLPHSSVSSGVFEVLSTGRLPADHPHHPDMWHSTIENPYKGHPPQLSDVASPMAFSHVYDKKYGFAEYTPVFTTKTDDFTGFVDHVWVSEEIKVECVLAHPLHGVSRPDVASRVLDFEPIPNKVSILACELSCQINVRLNCVSRCIHRIICLLGCPSPFLLARSEELVIFMKEIFNHFYVHTL